MPLDLIENAGKIERTAPNGKKYWQYLGKYKCSFCSAIVFRRRPNENNSCGCQQNNRAVYRATGPTGHIKHDRGEAALHCRNYQGCLNRIKTDPDFKMDCKHCGDKDKKENCFMDEIQDAAYGGDSFEKHICYNSATMR